MRSPAILSGSMAFSQGQVDWSVLKRACTINYQPMGEPEPFTLEAFYEADGLLHVPRQLGLQVCRNQGIDYVDRTSPGHAVFFPRVPELRDYQVLPFTEILQALDGFYDFIFRARTGFGKTLVSLIVAARRGVSTLVLVDQENLKAQWIDSLVKHFGFTVDQIGLVQGKVCKFKGCSVTIAMVQTLSKKDFPQELYDYFGLMIVDEVHIIGAPTFSRILTRFSAGYRMGVSATPKRRDGLQKVLDYNLGKVRVYVDDEHQENSVYVAEHDSVYSFYANVSPKTGRFISEVSDDASRNLLIAESAEFLWSTGRDVLVLSDRIEHLRHLMSLCEYLGIDREAMGIYAGYRPLYGFNKEATPSRRPAGLERGSEYTPISLQLISKRTKKKELASVKETCQIIFATYGMFSKGVDEPRLSGGIDATPRSQAEQVHGRVLRQVQGKMRAIWITIADTRSYRSLHGLANRLTDYTRNNAKTYRWSLANGETECNVGTFKAEIREEVARLKSLRIETRSDGLNMLVTPQGQIARAKQRVRDIKKIIHLHSPGSQMDSVPEETIEKLLVKTSTSRLSERLSPYLKRRRR